MQQSLPNKSTNGLRVARYARILAWLLLDCLRKNKLLAVTMLVADAVGLACLGFSVSAAAFYAELLETGSELTLLGETFVVRESYTLLIMFSSAVLTSLCVMASLGWLSQNRSLHFRKRYQNLCSARALDLVGSRLPLLESPPSNRKETSQIQRLCRGDPMFLGRIAQFLVRAVVPAGTCAVLGIFLFVMHWQLTVLVLAVGSLSFVFQFRASRAAARAGFSMERAAPGASKAYRSAVSGCAVLTEPDVGNALLRMPPVQDYTDGFMDRISAVHSSRLIGNMLMAITLGLVLAIFGADIMASGSGWGILIIYLAAMQKTMTSFRSVMTIITSVNRFYPALRRYRVFVEEMHAPPLLPDELHGIPQRLCVVTPVSLNRFTARFLLNILGFPTTGSDSPSIAVVPSPKQIPTDTAVLDPRHENVLRTWAGGESQVDPDTLRYLAAAAVASARITLVHADQLRILPHSCVANILQNFDGIVIITAQDDLGPLADLADRVDITNNEEVIASGDAEWYRTEGSATPLRPADNPVRHDPEINEEERDEFEDE